MIWEVGETVRVNSELPLLPGPPPTTVRRGDIVQPAATSIIAIAIHLKQICKVGSSPASRVFVRTRHPWLRHRILSWIVFPCPVFAGLNAKDPVPRYSPRGEWKNKSCHEAFGYRQAGD